MVKEQALIKFFDKVRELVIIQSLKYKAMFSNCLKSKGSLNKIQKT